MSPDSARRAEVAIDRLAQSGVSVLGFVGPEVDPACSEVGDFTTRHRSPLEDILLPGDLKTFKTCGHDRGLKRCFQQRTSYSVGPQINVAFGALWNLLLHGDICYLDSPTGPKNTVNLFEHSSLVWGEVDYTV